MFLIGRHWMVWGNWFFVKENGSHVFRNFISSHKIALYSGTSQNTSFFRECRKQNWTKMQELAKKKYIMFELKKKHIILSQNLEYHTHWMLNFCMNTKFQGSCLFFFFWKWAALPSWWSVDNMLNTSVGGYGFNIVQGQTKYLKGVRYSVSK